MERFKVQITGDYVPRYAKEGDSGCDVRAAEYFSIPPGGFKMVDLGIQMAIPPELDCQIRPRSGLTCMGIMAGLGTVDSGYRGTVKAVLFNLSDRPFVSMKGDRVGQLVFTRVERVEFVPVLELPDSERGSDGFGSTGRK